MSTAKPLPIEIPAWKINDRDGSGGQHIYRFGNEHGASVVRGPYTYGGPDGLFELAVIVFDGDEWDLTYATPITEDVLGYLQVAEVAELLVRIAALPAASTS